MIGRAKECVSVPDTCSFERKSLTAWHERGFSGDYGLDVGEIHAGVWCGHTTIALGDGVG